MIYSITCTYCSEEIEIQIKDVKYCRNCFNRFFIRKVGKSLCVLPKKCNVLVVTVNDFASKSLTHVLEAINLRCKNLIFVKISTEGLEDKENEYLKKENNSEIEQKLLNDNLIIKQEFEVIEKYWPEITERAITLQCCGILFAVATEDIVYDSIKKLLIGAGKKCAFLAGDRSIGDIKLINCFSKISRDEVYKFVDLNEISAVSPKIKKLTITEEFMDTVFERNCGVFNNFVELLKKI